MIPDAFANFPESDCITITSLTAKKSQFGWMKIDSLVLFRSHNKIYLYMLLAGKTDDEWRKLSLFLKSDLPSTDLFWSELLNITVEDIYLCR
jgi:hypothetical protein